LVHPQVASNADRTISAILLECEPKPVCKPGPDHLVFLGNLLVLPRGEWLHEKGKIGITPAGVYHAKVQKSMGWIERERERQGEREREREREERGTTPRNQTYSPFRFAAQQAAGKLETLQHVRSASVNRTCMLRVTSRIPHVQ
jgi:hypothetical protein